MSVRVHGRKAFGAFRKINVSVKHHKIRSGHVYTHERKHPVQESGELQARKPNAAQNERIVVFYQNGRSEFVEDLLAFFFVANLDGKHRVILILHAQHGAFLAHP